MKIFCTGWQRTGTTSLARALSSIGIRTLDYPKELFHDVDDKIVERYQAFTDNPIPLVYRELDARYPGAKFLHTERDEEPWLKSIEWLFTIGRIKFEWSNRPIINEMHERLYGTTRFDPERFLERYREHNAEVRAYFAERPEDLLVLDVTAGDGFERICPFLGLEMPDHEFPHTNPAEKGWKVVLRRVRDALLARPSGKR